MVAMGLHALGFHTQFHEDQSSTGIPDMSYGFQSTNGWIETKWKTIKLEPQQPRWLEARSQAGGHCFLLLGIPTGWQLIEWSSLSFIQCRMTEVQQFSALLAELLITSTPWLEAAPSDFHSQITHRIPPEVLRHLGSQDLERLIGRTSPFPAIRGGYLLEPGPSSNASLPS